MRDRIRRRFPFAVVVAATLAALAVMAEASRRRSARLAELRTTGDVVPGTPRQREELVDTAIEDSFPASDPPSYWGRVTPG